MAKSFHDAAFMTGQPNADAGVYCNIFSVCIPVDTDITAYDGEIKVIRASLEEHFCFLDKFTEESLSHSRATFYSMESGDCLCPSLNDVLNVNTLFVN